MEQIAQAISEGFAELVVTIIIVAIIHGILTS